MLFLQLAVPAVVLSIPAVVLSIIGQISVSSIWTPQSDPFVTAQLVEVSQRPMSGRLPTGARPVRGQAPDVTGIDVCGRRPKMLAEGKGSLQLAPADGSSTRARWPVAR